MAPPCSATDARSSPPRCARSRGIAAAPAEPDERNSGSSQPGTISGSPSLTQSAKTGSRLLPRTVLDVADAIGDLT